MHTPTCKHAIPVLPIATAQSLNPEPETLKRALTVLPDRHGLECLAFTHYFMTPLLHRLRQKPMPPVPHHFCRHSTQPSTFTHESIPCVPSCGEGACACLQCVLCVSVCLCVSVFVCLCVYRECMWGVRTSTFACSHVPNFNLVRKGRTP